jgi:hypothetical protein
MKPELSDISHGNRGGGPLHNVATIDFAGFMSAADKLSVSRLFSAPVTQTADFTVADSDFWLICNKAGTTSVTLPDPTDNSTRVLIFKTIQAQAVSSAGSNVVPIEGGAASTSILPATDGAWAVLVNDGTNWITMMRGT